MNKQNNILSRRPCAALSWLAAGCAAALLAGCGTSVVSRGLNAEGVASEVVFPDIAGRATLPEGTFVNLDNLRAVGAGLSKAQLYDLLGTPHFQEGLFGVREWDYVFNFRSGGGVTTCQYKVLFDKDYLARSFHWKPDTCAAVLAANPTPAPVVAAAAPVPMPAASRSFRLTADALFAFDRAGVADLKPDGRRAIDQLAAELKGAQYERVEVLGHTDRLGSADYNLRLSQQRANTVRAVLVEGGVPASRIAARGRGAADPVVQCSQSARAALIECLAPNRRVDVSAQASSAR
ncbi:MAG: outer membrane protein assembly factor BamE [Comamonadaceae bacterium]|nr:MAG: outer membrane protein assembly factor BamE [Comamonadaceae bacterium]